MASRWLRSRVTECCRWMYVKTTIVQTSMRRVRLGAIGLSDYWDRVIVAKAFVLVASGAPDHKRHKVVDHEISVW